MTDHDVPDVALLRKRVSAFVRDRVFPCEPLLDAGGPAAGEVRERLRAEARGAGLWALPLPSERGGGGLTLSAYASLAEAEGASDHGPAALGSASLLDVTMLSRHGSSRVRSDCLTRLVAGDLRACYAMTEPDAPGTEPALTATRGERRAGGGWSVTGRKWFVSNAADADLVTVLARTSGSAGDREGLSLLLVPTDSPGFRVVRELPVLGATGQYEIELDHVEVAEDGLVGAPGRALAVAGERLQLGRTLRALRWIGQAQRAFDLMCGRATARQGVRGPLADRQLVQQHVFEALLALRTARPLVHEAMALVAEGRDAQVEVGLAKTAAARTLQDVADRAVQVFGAAGLGPDTPLPSLFRTGRTARILDGPDEQHISSVARRVLRSRQDPAVTPS
ncbi:acyl-CoA dehydrogenase family protein [Streptomyces sp. NBC_00572]|uniref:acyl-CoA dehydrogenase family protein n=1 Tax=Streptomyces sp. NBC_00572 TaxID=2903664 RepID=UPI002259E6A8|nr:acyl-CoA dehydrogenase family protein [Streptomyces sp. NBC_00572]MCX4984715.1 acyl-CoA dehydrogenase family protein [Streptomyces sp. NBC_00572]